MSSLQLEHYTKYIWAYTTNVFYDETHNKWPKRLKKSSFIKIILDDVWICPPQTETADRETTQNNANRQSSSDTTHTADSTSTTSREKRQTAKEEEEKREKRKKVTQFYLLEATILEFRYIIRYTDTKINFHRLMVIMKVMV